MRSLADLPEELLLDILDRIDTLSVVPLSKTCRRLRALLLTPQVLAKRFAYKHRLWNDPIGMSSRKTARQAILEADLSLRCLTGRKALRYYAFQEGPMQVTCDRLCPDPTVRDGACSPADDAPGVEVIRGVLDDGLFAVWQEGDFHGTGHHWIQVHDLDNGQLKTQIASSQHIDRIILHDCRLFVSRCSGVRPPSQHYGGTIQCVEIRAYDLSSGEVCERYSFERLNVYWCSDGPSFSANNDYLVLFLKNEIRYHHRNVDADGSVAAIISLSTILRSITQADAVGSSDAPELCHSIVTGVLEREVLWLELSPLSSATSTARATVYGFDLKRYIEFGVSWTVLVAMLRQHRLFKYDITDRASRARSLVYQMGLNSLVDSRSIDHYLVPVDGSFEFRSSAISRSNSQPPGNRDGFTYFSHLPAMAYWTCGDDDDDGSTMPPGLFVMIHRSALEPPWDKVYDDATCGWLDRGRLRGPGEPDDQALRLSLGVHYDSDVITYFNERWFVADAEPGYMAWQIGKDAPP